MIITIADPAAARALDLLDRAFVAPAPNRTWGADFTHVAAWAGVVYVSFVVDTFSRRIVGWSASMSKETQLALEVLDMGLWQCDREGRPPAPGELVHHSDARRSAWPNTSMPSGSRPPSARSATRINALMESTIGLYKTEVIKPMRPWKTLAHVELATPSGSTGTTTVGSTVR
ncbi:DDE-type integrase/transposase/recombinase [Streptomyces sp. NPDC052107]|uniref:DDE-type integrase/transposase/recombinase n=1 Tax=Streptomyces sp. NPDC052107 TaxID=3155632 RepID=UPI003441FC8C